MTDTYKGSQELQNLNEHKKANKKAGRPRINLDKSQIFELAKIHCTMKEIASVMKCSVDTLERNYADIIKEGKDIGKTSLRRYMWQAAKNGNVTMLIWLSKQKELLQMRDPEPLTGKEENKTPFNEWFREKITREIDDRAERKTKDSNSGL